MLQCGLLRSNFSLAIGVLRALFQVEGKPGAGSGNRTRIFSLEGCCTTIVLYPPLQSPTALRRVVGEVGLEPTKAYARGFTVPPLCRSGHSPSRTEPVSGPDRIGSRPGRLGALRAPKANGKRPPIRGPNLERVL